MQKAKEAQNKLKLKSWLHMNRLQKKFMRGDGNCFFRAAADQLFGDEELHPLLRVQAYEVVSHNLSYFRRWFAHEDDPDGELRRWLTDLQTFGVDGQSSGGYAGFYEMVALSALYDINFIVHSEGNGDQAHVLAPSGADARYLHLHYTGNHWNSVRGFDEPDKTPAPVRRAAYDCYPKEQPPDNNVQDITVPGHVVNYLRANFTLGQLWAENWEFYHRLELGAKDFSHYRRQEVPKGGPSTPYKTMGILQYYEELLGGKSPSPGKFTRADSKSGAKPPQFSGKASPKPGNSGPINIVVNKRDLNARGRSGLGKRSHSGRSSHNKVSPGGTSLDVAGLDIKTSREAS